MVDSEQIIILDDGQLGTIPSWAIWVKDGIGTPLSSRYISFKYAPILTLDTNHETGWVLVQYLLMGTYKEAVFKRPLDYKDIKKWALSQ